MGDRMKPLLEKYRPLTISDLAGQPFATGKLASFAADPYSTSFLFSGETGIGKTAAAHCLAHDLGCDVDAGEMGGVWTIASGEMSADGVRDVYSRLQLVPMFGNGWKVCICNECDRMSTAAETIWLDRLETLLIFRAGPGSA